MTKKIISTIVIFFVLLFSITLLAQSNLSFEQNINLPANNYGGNVVFDILTANNKVFVYSPKKVIVYSATGETELGSIVLSTDTAKFNPKIILEIME